MSSNKTVAKRARRAARKACDLKRAQVKDSEKATVIASFLDTTVKEIHHIITYHEQLRIAISRGIPLLEVQYATEPTEDTEKQLQVYKTTLEQIVGTQEFVKQLHDCLGRFNDAKNDKERMFAVADALTPLAVLQVALTGVSMEIEEIMPKELANSEEEKANADDVLASDGLDTEPVEHDVVESSDTTVSEKATD